MRQFTDAEIDMLLNLVMKAAEDGSYYGNKKQYFDRLANIEKKLNNMIASGQEK